jgi:hypothetical protein
MPVEPRSQGFASGPVLFNPRKKWNDLNPRERGMSSAGPISLDGFTVACVIACTWPSLWCEHVVNKPRITWSQRAVAISQSHRPSWLRKRDYSTFRITYPR